MRYDEIPSKTVWIKDSSPPPLQSLQNLINRQFTVSRGDFIPIDNLLELYPKAWSPMAKRNLLVDLGRAIATWQAAHPAEVLAAMTALKDLVDRLKQAIPSFQRYTHVICTGWKVNCKYTPSIGHSADDPTDMELKCANIVKAAIAAKVRVKLGTQNATDPAKRDDDHTLKIFMAPEFYFRGKNGAYSPELVSQILPRLKKSFSTGWDNWLFVFGTAVAAFADDSYHCKTCGSGNSKITFEQTAGGQPKAKCDKDTGNSHVAVLGAEVHNVALVSYAGEDHLVAKEYVSPIDFVANSVYVGNRLHTVLPSAGSKASRIKSVFDDERLGGCILNFAGVTVGIEVCLDHVKSTREPSLGVGRGAAYSGLTQVLLIPSFGMDIKNKLYCRDGGVVFNVDGRGEGTTDLMRNGLPKPAVANIKVVAAPGSVDVWDRVTIPL